MPRIAMVVALVAALGCGSSGAGPVTAPGAGGGFPGLDRIQEADLRADLFALADDHFRGREAGTLDELRASAWLAERARAIGLEPAGDDGSYFQFWSIRRTRIGAGSRFVVDGDEIAIGVDAVALTPVGGRADDPVVNIGTRRADEVDAAVVAGKIVVAEMAAPRATLPPDMSLRPMRYAFAAVNERGPGLIAKGARAVIVVGDATADSGWAFAAASRSRGSYGLDSAGIAPRPVTNAGPIIWVRSAMADRVRRAGRIEISIVAETFLYPSVNVVGKVPGRDRSLAGQWVLFSGHQDHDGVRAPIAGDSIWNGADDNATVSVALLGIGRAFVARPGRRSALFVWHGAEERGLLGSRWHVAHPMVPRDSIVAVLNADMLGHNAPDSAALLGAQPPHRNSTGLASLALLANDRVTRFKLDTIWDRPTHREGWYFRSDHLPYARAGVPSVMFSTLLHQFYHTPEDEAERIDVAKLTGMTRWMYATGWLVAEAESRPGLDAGFKLER